MTRILVADDERPVIEGISHIVRRDLAGEFEVVGSASSGREAIEKAATLSPDLILMDVRMPGISGLDAIREIRRRGSPSAFILVTAYERFDIAREAVELGVLDYLLKPVAKDALAQSLRQAAVLIARRGETEKREMEHREREEGMRGFVEAAFLQALILGERSAAEIAKYCAALGLAEPRACLIAAAFLPPRGAPDPEAEARAAYEALRGTLRYKTRAFAGPLVARSCALFLPLRAGPEGEGDLEQLRLSIEAAHGQELARGRLRLGYGKARALGEAALSWSEALAGLFAGAAPQPGPGLDFEKDEALLDSLLESSPAHAALPAQVAFEALVAPYSGLPSLPTAAVFRLIALLGSAVRTLRGRGLLGPDEAAAAMDFADLLAAAEGPSFELVLRSRFSLLLAAAGRESRPASPLGSALAILREDFPKPLTLESVAAEIGIAPARLSRLLIDETGKGFSDLLIDYRIERAKELLVLPEASIKQVSAACGYPDPNYFSRLFKKVTGLTPSAFSSVISEGNNETS